MEQFEKWWNKVGQYMFSTYLTKEQSKIVWEAALTQVRNNNKSYEIIDAIDEELGG